MKGCRPADWIKEPLRNEWTIDPLILDASFQLAGYWAWVKHQRAGFPLSLGRFVQLAPFGLGPLKVTVTFESAQRRHLHRHAGLAEREGRRWWRTSPA